MMSAAYFSLFYSDQAHNIFIKKYYTFNGLINGYQSVNEIEWIHIKQVPNHSLIPSSTIVIIWLM
jgi:hypothetical protein